MRYDKRRVTRAEALAEAARIQALFRRYRGGEMGPREAREFVGLSAGQVCNALGIPRAMVDEIDGGRCTNPIVRERYEALVDAPVRW